jgi:tRNA (guanine-N7-)-methyltransferase
MQQNDFDEADESLFDASQPLIRGRFFRDEDRVAFRDWILGAQTVELEIGSGKGLYLLNEAPRRPEVRFVGLELAAKYAWEAQSKVEKRQHGNLRFYACDAVAVMDQDVADSSLDAVHVYFPDPWWKAKHKKRRVLSEQTLINIQRTLKPGGELHFWTDVLDYYELTLELIDQVTSLSGPFFVSETPSEHSMDFRTHFERRTRLNGLPVYRSLYRKDS